MSDVDTWIEEHRFCRDHAHNDAATIALLGKCTCAQLLRTEDVRSFATALLKHAEKAEAELARVSHDRAILLNALYEIERGDYEMGAHEDIAGRAIAAHLKQEAGNDE